MKLKIVSGVVLIAVLVAGVGVLAVGADGASKPESKESAEAPTEAAETPDSPLVPLPSMPAELQQEAQLLVGVNQVIAEVTKEAMERPKDDRMTPEEVRALIRERIAELGVRP